MKVEFGKILSSDSMGFSSVQLHSGLVVIYPQDKYLPRKQPWEEFPREYKRAYQKNNPICGMPRAGSRVVVIRDYSEQGLHAWMTRKEWDECVQDAKDLPMLQVIRTKEGKYDGVVWQGHPADDGRAQLRQLSLLFPRTESGKGDLIAATYLGDFTSSRQLDEGMRIEARARDGGWSPSPDCRVPEELIPITRWGLDLSPISP